MEIDIKKIEVLYPNIEVFDKFNLIIKPFLKKYIKIT